MWTARQIRSPFVTLGLLIALSVIGYFFLPDHQNEPLCHKGLLVALSNWPDRHGTTELPNVDGHSAQSLAQLREFLGDDPWAEKYRYVPGLKIGDPGDLVLAYMPVPTRYIYHGNPQTIFAEPKWILIPLDFTWHYGVGLPDDREIPLAGEQCERVPLEELRRRLQKTLEFLQTNNRPNWQAIAVEHRQVLDALPN